jgi:hypothetical protein
MIAGGSAWVNLSRFRAVDRAAIFHSSHGLMMPTASSNIQQEFSERLLAVIDRAGCKRSATKIAREFNSRSPDSAVTLNAVRKWLKGEAIPAQSRLVVLAQWFCVDAHWLRFGDSESGTMGMFDGARDERSSDRILVRDILALSSEHKAIVREIIRGLAAIR